MTTVLDSVRRAARARILYLPHAVKQMALPERLISVGEVEEVVLQGDLLEDYPDDVRGHSCLLMGAPRGRPVHVVCSPRADYLAIITAYLPDLTKWSPEFRRRID
jgi:hypothetical protein